MSPVVRNDERTVLNTVAVDSAATTNIEAAHRQHARAVDRVRSLEASLDQAFEQLYTARQELKERAGVDAVCEFTDPVRAAWAHWLGVKEVGRMREREETPEEMLGEDAVKLANAHGDHGWPEEAS